jgi:hypothetical protein
MVGGTSGIGLELARRFRDGGSESAEKLALLSSLSRPQTTG